MSETKFDAAKVGDLAKQIEAAQKECIQLKKNKEEAVRAENSADVKLSNLRLEFSRASASMIDTTILTTDRPLR